MFQRNLYHLCVPPSRQLSATPRLLRRSGLVLAATLLFLAPTLAAAHGQTGGEAGIQGTVTDSTGAAIPQATIAATNNAGGVVTTRQSTGDGLYSISPIPPGTYTVTITAPGFSQHLQKNFTIDALVLTPLNVTMSVGEQTTCVTVNEAPPQLETTNATLGLTIENTVYANLPLSRL